MEGAVCIDSLAVAEMATRGQERLATYKQQHPISGIEGRIPFYKETIDIIGQAILAGNTSRNQIESYLRSYDETKSRKGYVGEYYFDANGDAVGL
jgi:hypothetical protein